MGKYVVDKYSLRISDATTLVLVTKFPLEIVEIAATPLPNATWETRSSS